MTQLALSVRPNRPNSLFWTHPTIGPVLDIWPHRICGPYLGEMIWVLEKVCSLATAPRACEDFDDAFVSLITDALLVPDASKRKSCAQDYKISTPLAESEILKDVRWISDFRNIHSEIRILDAWGCF